MIVRNVLALTYRQIAVDKIRAVVGKVDAESTGEASWTGPLAGCANEYASWDSFGFYNDIQHVVDAVVEIDVGVSRGTEDNFGARCHSGVGMCGRIVRRKISFGFRNSRVEVAVHDVCAEQIAGDLNGGSRKEATI